ncbi:MAG: MurR/RpiR family transcriptional regulator [Erysipelotrichaceae bacterium]|nr:MurR/RpiR family transcriptional regulator [Erysipelotrichaceae bacterium]MDY5252816.1 MurR/RpiR family transcriptional regulator [Erysipelotrichaceae bacterium]
MLNVEQIKSLNELETLVYDYILKNSKQILNMKVREVADAVHVSTTTVLRFCKKVDCNGFSEFKIKYGLYLNDKEISSIQNDIPMLITSFSQFNNAEFYEKIEKVAKIIFKSDSVITTGIGTSGILAKYAARYFANIGKITFCIDDPFYPITPSLSNNAVVIALSESGETEETIQHVQEFRRRGCYIIAITNRHECPLVKLANDSFNYYLPTRKVKESINITSQVPVIFLIETLANRLKNVIVEEKNNIDNI